MGGRVSTSIFRNWDLLLMGGFAILFVLQWRGLADRMGGGSLDLSAEGLVLGGLMKVVLAGFVPVALMRRVDLVEFFGLRWEGWRHLFWIVPVFVVGVIFLANLVVLSGWQEWVKKSYGGGQQEVVRAVMESGDVKFMLAALFAAAVCAPIGEELIFRGFLYPVAKRFSERWFATIFSSMLFGVVHWNLAGLPMLFVMGVLFVILYERTGSLWAPILCHAVFNGLMVGMMVLSKFVEVPM